MSTTDDPTDPRLTRGVDDTPRDMAPTYLVLSDDERAQGFVRPVRASFTLLIRQAMERALEAAGR